MARLSAFCTIASPTLAAQIATSSANARVIGSICHRRKERPRNSSRIPSFASGLPCINQATSDDIIPPNAEGGSLSGADFAVGSGCGVGCARHGSMASATGSGRGSLGSAIIASAAIAASGVVGATAVASAAGACSAPRRSSSSTRRRKAASSKRTAALRLRAIIATIGATTSPQNKITPPKISRSSMFPPSLVEEGAE